MARAAKDAARTLLANAGIEISEQTAPERLRPAKRKRVSR